MKTLILILLRLMPPAVAGVEDIRELLDKVPIAPVVADKKVYIIDEVHMLSKSAFNALLKTLEEPPTHVVFIFATTDPEKIPPTIISRTQQFHFHLIQPPVIAKHLRTIAEAEQINIDDEALLLLAERAEGGFRDAITMLDQVAGFSEPGAPITHTDIESLLGLAPRETVMALLASYPQDPRRAIELLLLCANRVLAHKRYYHSCYGRFSKSCHTSLIYCRY